ncbi:MAG: DUF6683 family protein [Pseudomonadota bacterium]|jgi:hypothetical protein|nr:hypothetical protein [Rubrivivax sp.]MCA3258256.1 hypothetical protein [Rubrivivax sp.]MCE2913213.1 hypothetical protein [Rubrivivax sp.]MCZ8030664.1 hypothetical protein [Rubrivivax sp.]
MHCCRAALAPLVLAATLACGPASAQFNSFGAPSVMSIANMNAYLSIHTNAALVRDAQTRLNAVNQVGAAVKAAPAAAGGRLLVPAAPQTTFRPQPRRLLVQGFAESLSTNPAEVKELVDVFTQGFGAFESEARRLGRPNNVAMAFAYLVGVCYMVHHGLEPSEAALLNLQANSDAAFGSLDNFKALKDPEQQKLYESFVLMATLPLMGYTVAVAQNDRTLLATYREAAGAALETVLGVRPDRLKFTATGLEVRR